MRSFLMIALLVAAAVPASAQEITGIATAYETDKIMIDGERILLWGIDSLDGDQRYCVLEGRDWGCWAVAHRALEILVDEGPVTCQRVDENEAFGCTWGVCEVNGRDLGEEMVRSGMAFAYRPQTDRYVAAEEAARARKASRSTRACTSRTAASRT